MEKSYPCTLLPRYPGAREYPYCLYTQDKEMGEIPLNCFRQGGNGDTELNEMEMNIWESTAEIRSEKKKYLKLLHTTSVSCQCTYNV